jgi:hypothetical protein
VAIRRLIQGQGFDPKEIQVLSKVFEDTLSSLHLVNRADPISEYIAKKIIECAQKGERDPVRLREYAMKAIKT